MSLIASVICVAVAVALEDGMVVVVIGLGGFEVVMAMDVAPVIVVGRSRSRRTNRSRN